jgi:ArsR family transcriptional regulator
MTVVSEADLEEWADWFKCLADPTRLKILHYVSNLAEPATVGQIVEAVGKSQSTVSKHLQILGQQQFVLTDAAGIRTMVKGNPLCMTELPKAAAAIMGTPPKAS